ncbi:MAG: ribokinase [Defluviitaleaceae bacterium]|nr:ribokinase [Defluviitaleaceae bacterium]
MGKIIVLGGINQDLIITAPRLPRIGETVMGNGFCTANGGKAANQAVAAARLGGDVILIGAVGGDAAGSKMINNFSNEGIDTSFTKIINGMPTGTAVITVCGGDNSIVMDAGANSALMPEHIGQSEEAFLKAEALVVQMEIPQETVEYSIKLAKKHGLAVMLDPAPASEINKKIFEMVDVVKPNETESEFYTGIKTSTKEEAAKAVAFFKGLGVETAIVTLGEKGSVYNDFLSGEIFYQDAFEINSIIDTTAAGDCFMGAVAVMLSEKKKMAQAIKFASCAAALAVTKMGAQPSLPTRGEVEKICAF